MKIAVIDIGTLKVKFLVVEALPPGKPETIYQSNTLTCLGVRMHENDNRPLPEYLQQTIDELKRCKEIIDKEGIERLRVVSTHALREMGEVGTDIAKRVKNEIGLDIEIISQDEEANLFYRAVLKDFKTNKDFTIVDVGGGSVQILIGNKKRLKSKYLLKTGAQYLFDRFSPRHTGDDHPTREEIRNMQEYVMKELVPIPECIGTPVIYGSSCIIDVFKKIGLKLERYYLSKSHPYRVEISEIENFLEKIISVPYDQREKEYKLDQQFYMWGIEKAFLNIVSICKKEQSPFVVPSNFNINDGLILSLLE